ncbi:MAG TPA: FAD:protein FMN transferase [Usitatibacter sp.]|nr:FAD:protein FMN transferase [Usitatibacter sp.]
MESSASLTRSEALRAPHLVAFRAMAAVNEIQLYADDPVHARVMAAGAITEVRRIEAKYSRYRADSVVSRINAAAGGPAVAIDEETAKLLDYAEACYRQSRGRFDPTSGVLRRAWRFEAGAPIPTANELDPLLAKIGWHRVERKAGTIRLPIAGMEIDFGGFGKEYAVDRAALALREAGARNAVVNLAGDLAVLGPQADGSPWRIGVRHPRRADAAIATIPVSSGALATSGDYERFVEVEGVRHCHVLDPRTGRSARGFQSVTVHAHSCLVAGSACTIAMLTGRDEGLAWLESLSLPYLAVLEDGIVVDRFRESR